MKHRIIFLILLVIGGFTVAGTKISRLTRTASLQSNSLFVTVTGDVNKVTRYIQAHDLGRELGPYITNVVGSGSGSVETQWIPDQTQFFTNTAGALVIRKAALVTNTVNNVSTNYSWAVFKESGGTESFNIGYSPVPSLQFSNTASGFVQLELNEVGTTVIRGTLNVSAGGGGVGNFNVASNAAISGTNLAAWLKLTGGQGGQGVFAILDNNTNIIGWVSTNSFPTHTQLGTASNALHTLLLSASNGLHSITLSSSNGLHSLLLSASNALSTSIANLQGATNGLNVAVGNLQGATNSLNTRAGNLEGATNSLHTRAGNLEGATNGLNAAMALTLTNYYGFGYSVGAGFSNNTSKPLVTAKSNRMLEVMNIVAGANIAFTPASTGIVITATGASLADGDYGDVTATAGGATITIDNDVVTDAKLRESAGFSVIGKTDTGTGNPADIVAGTDGVLRRSGSGNLSFGSLVTANYGDDSVTYAKIQNVTENRILGRDSAGAGNTEELSAGLGLDISGGSLTMLGDQVLGSGRFTNSLAASNINTRQLIVTNTFELGTTNTGLGTNLVINWNGPSIVESYPTNTTFMVSFVGTPAASNGLGKTIRHRIILTNTPTMIGPSGVGWLNPPVLISGSTTTPSTNIFTYTFTGNTNIDAISLQTSNLLSGTLISGAHITGSVVSNSVVFNTIFTNGVLLSSGATNVDWVSGVTGYVNGATARLGVTASGSGTGATNTPVLATGTLDLTNQIKLRPQDLNGSNSYSVMMDFLLQTHKKVTNPIGAHTRFIGTNYTQGHRILMTLRGLPGTTNNVQFTNGLSGVNFRFNEWPTNQLTGGTNDITVRGGYNYLVDAFVEDPTNVVFKINTDDPFVVVPEVYIGVSHIGTNDVESITNLSSVNWRLLTMLIPTNNSASNITINYALSNRVEIYLTNNATFTNYSGYVAGRSGTKQLWIRPQLITRGVNWGVGIGYSIRVLTNASNPLWTSLTNDKLYVVTDDWQGTNIIRTIALFE